MTETERQVVRLRREQRNPQPASEAKKPAAEGSPDPLNPPRKDAENAFNLRAMSGLPRGVPDDTLRAARCRLSKGKLLGLVAVQYHPDGLPRSVSPFETDASDACEAAALSLAVLALAPDDEFPIGGGRFEIEKGGIKTTVGGEPKTDVLFVVARPDCVSVMEEADVCPSVCPEDRDEVRRVGGRVEAPKLRSGRSPSTTSGSDARERKARSFSRPSSPPTDASRTWRS